MAESVERRDGSDGWLLSDQEYQQLKKDSEFLANLEAAGVDNWEGYCYGYGLEGNDEDEEY